MLQKVKSQRENMFFFLILIVVMTVTMYWCVQKSDMFIDEIATYGLSNSYYAPFIQYIPEDDILNNKVLTQEQLHDFLTVSSEDAFQYDSVYYNQTQDTQPPLYYFLLHTACSVFQESYSKWIGLAINLVLYFFTIIILYQIGQLILGSKKYAALAVLLYGLSYGGLSTVLMIRMYILLTFLTTCYTYFWIKLYQGCQKKWHRAAIGILIFLGMFTQYFFVMFAFFSSAVYCLRELWYKRFKNFILYAVHAFGGILLFYLSYPCVMDQLFADKLVSGKTAVDNMLDIRGMLLSIYSFIMQILASYKAGLLMLVIALCLGIVLRQRFLKEYFSKFDIKDSSEMAVIIALGLAILVTAVASPVTALRYVYNMLPLVAVTFVYFMKIFVPGFFKVEKVFFVVFIGVCLIRGISTIPEYVESVPTENYNIMERYKEFPCVYVDKVYAGPSEDMLELIKFKEIYFTDDISCEDTLNYIKSVDTGEGVILYIDVAEYLGSGYDANQVLSQLIENTDFSGCDLLCKQSFTETYLVY